MFKLLLLNLFINFILFKKKKKCSWLNIQSMHEKRIIIIILLKYNKINHIQNKKKVKSLIWIKKEKSVQKRFFFFFLKVKSIKYYSFLFYIKASTLSLSFFFSITWWHKRKKNKLIYLFNIILDLSIIFKMIIIINFLIIYFDNKERTNNIIHYHDKININKLDSFYFIYIF